MAITPYSQPIRTEYKPLGLERFAKPLSVMQEKYDTVTNQIATSDFDMAHLPYGTDPERAKALKELVESKRNELAQNLAKTKNYTQATQKIIELQKLWKNDPEKKALEGNYQTFQEAVKDYKKRYEKDGDADEYNWAMKNLEGQYSNKNGASFKADYMNPEGEYNKVNPRKYLANIQKEIEAAKVDIAKLTPAEKYNTFRAAGIDLDTGDKRYEDLSVEEKKAIDIEQATEKYLRSVPRFNAYLSQRAAMEYEANSYGEDKGSKLNEKLYSKRIDEINAKHNELLELSKGKDVNAEYAKKALESDDFKEILKQKEELQASIDKGEYDKEIGLNLHMRDVMGEHYDASAIADVLDYKHVKKDYSFRRLKKTDEDIAGAGKSKDKDPYVITGLDEEINYDGFTKTKEKYGAALYSKLPELHKAGNGAWRMIAIPDEAMTKDLNKMVLRDKAIQNSLRGAKTETEFKENLKKNGIELQGKQFEAARNLFNTYQSSPRLRDEINSNMEEIQYSQNIRSTAIQQQKMFDEKIFKQEDFLNSDLLNNFGKHSISPGSAKLAVNAPSMAGGGTSVISKQSPITFDDIAKKNGYKNAKDAFLKGFDFSGVGTNGRQLMREFNALKQQSITRNNIKNEMSSSFINNPVVANIGGQMFETINDLTQYNLAFNSWENQAGFETSSDETGNRVGIPKADTKLAISKTLPVRLGKAGSVHYFEVPVSHKEGGVVKTEYVKLIPKPEMKPLVQKFLVSLDNATKGRQDAAQAQTNDHVKVMMFDNMFPNDISYGFNTIDINEENKSAEIGRALIEGKDVVFTKEKGNALKPYIKIQVYTADGKPYGQPDYADDPEAAKLYIQSNL